MKNPGSALFPRTKSNRQAQFKICNLSIIWQRLVVNRLVGRLEVNQLAKSAKIASRLKKISSTAFVHPNIGLIAFTSYLSSLSLTVLIYYCNFTSYIFFHELLVLQARESWSFGLVL